MLAFWLWRVEPRAWVRRLGFIALGAVITQGMLGGITVLWYLPDPISIAHASLAQIVFCLTIDDRARHVAGLAARLRERAGARRPHRCSASPSSTTAIDLPADPPRRDDAAHGRGAGDP